MTVKNFESFSKLNEEMNYEYLQPSENGLGNNLKMLAQLATSADISYRAANEIKDQFLIIPSEYVDEYSNNKNTLLEEQLVEMMKDKDLARTNRMNPVKMN